MMQSNVLSKSKVCPVLIISCFLVITFWSSDIKAQTLHPAYNNSVTEGSTTIIERELSGSEGWYLFGSPFTSSTLLNLTDSLLTQGIIGSNDPSQIPNILLWNEAQQVWEAPDSMTSILGTAGAFAIYVFEDDDPQTEGIQGGFPKNISSSGDLNALPLAIPLTYVEENNNELNGFNLISNPTNSILDWEKIERANTTSSFYTWDPLISNYKVFQQDGMSVNGAEQYIYPFQAIWLKTVAMEASIDVDSVAISSNVQSKSKDDHSSDVSSVLLRLTNEDNFRDELRLVVRNSANTSYDSFDAVKLNSLSFQNISINSYSTDNVALAIDTRPWEEEMIFELDIESNNIDKELSLSLAENSFSDEWFVQLINTETSEHFDLKENDVKLAAGEYNWKIRITVLTTSTREPDYALPTILALKQNYPNPFNPSTLISYQLPKSANVELSVFNLLGKKVATLVDEQQSAGYHTINFDAQNLASGMYLYQLRTGNTVITKKLTLIK